MTAIRIYIKGSSQYAPIFVEDHEIQTIRERYEGYGHRVVVLEKEGESGISPPRINKEN